MHGVRDPGINARDCAAWFEPPLCIDRIWHTPAVHSVIVLVDASALARYLDKYERAAVEWDGAFKCVLHRVNLGSVLASVGLKRTCVRGVDRAHRDR